MKNASIFQQFWNASAMLEYGFTAHPIELEELFNRQLREMPSVADHVIETAVIARNFASAHAFSAADSALVTVSALLHDIGKLFVPSEILHKCHALHEGEREVLRGHAATGLTRLAPYDPAGRLSAIVSQHHERFDGHGYPLGLCGQEIDPLARVISVIDAFSAMTEIRPYQPVRPVSWAFEELHRGAGTQFDAAIVQQFIALETTAWEREKVA